MEWNGPYLFNHASKKSQVIPHLQSNIERKKSSAIPILEEESPVPWATRNPHICRFLLVKNRPLMWLYIFKWIQIFKRSNHCWSFDHMGHQRQMPTFTSCCRNHEYIPGGTHISCNLAFSVSDPRKQVIKTSRCKLPLLWLWWGDYTLSVTLNTIQDSLLSFTVRGLRSWHQVRASQ